MTAGAHATHIRMFRTQTSSITVIDKDLHSRFSKLLLPTFGSPIIDTRTPLRSISPRRLSARWRSISKINSWTSSNTGNKWRFNMYRFNNICNYIFQYKLVRRQIIIYIRVLVCWPVLYVMSTHSTFIVNTPESIWDLWCINKFDLNLFCILIYIQPWILLRNVIAYIKGGGGWQF